jgi:hypothetical protein
VTGLLTDPGGWVKDTWDSVYDHIAVWNWETFLTTWKEFGRGGQNNDPEPQPSGRVRDVMANPEAHVRYTDKPEDLLNRLGGVPQGWREARLGQGSHAGQGWKLEEVTPDGRLTGRQIRWHPGGGRHGPDPYWVFSSSEHRTTKVIGPKYVP